MRKNRFTDAQIIGMIKEQEAGLPTAEVCRTHGLSPATFYKLQAKFGGMELSDAKRLKQLEDEHYNTVHPHSALGYRAPSEFINKRSKREALSETQGATTREFY